MTNYWDPRFLKHLNGKKIDTIFEVGARYGDETLMLSTIFPSSKIYSFECNPNTIHICKKNFENKNNIKFMPYGLGNNNERLPFYSYMNGNDGASSLFKRIDFNKTQHEIGMINICKLSDFVKYNNVNKIDLLCMDVQGYELNILKGAEDFIKHIRFVILEEPKPNVTPGYLPPNVHSNYINAPTSQEIGEFMRKHNFVEMERLEENGIEDNVMFENKNFNEMDYHRIN